MILARIGDKSLCPSSGIRIVENKVLNWQRKYSGIATLDVPRMKEPSGHFELKPLEIGSFIQEERLQVRLGRTLKAALVDSQGQLGLVDVERPRIGRGELLVKMKVCGICGTDLEKLHGVRVTPPVLGHEVAGEIEQVGEGVENYSSGDRIVVHHHVSCQTCHYCLRGDQTLCQEFPKSNLDPCGFAEYFRVPEKNVAKGAVFRIPDDMSYE